MSTPPPRSATELAKAALRRLTLDQLEPTPDNYARAYAQESGQPPPDAEPAAASAAVPLADWIERVVRGLERGGRQWTAARKKDSLQRVLAGSRADLGRLQQRLGQLLNNWDRDQPDSSPEELEADGAPSDTARDAASAVEQGPSLARAPGPSLGGAAASPAWPAMVGRLGSTVQTALPAADTAADSLAAELRGLTTRLQQADAAPVDAQALSELCDRADLLLAHRHHLMLLLAQLCDELTGSLTDLAEDDSWARGQCEAMRLKIEEGLTARGVKSVSELLRVTRERQGRLRRDRELARDALKGFIHQMLSELGELDQHTGRFHETVGRYADVIEQADTLESLAGVVREMVQESRTVHSLVGQAQQRLQTELARASALNAQVQSLEAELRRLSDEVSTDQLTQVANRRGLLAGFEAERARQARSGAELCVALLDVDNFKRLNDDLGHHAGDEALKTLAALVTRTLRPTDLVARYGGEEFVLLLPATPIDEARQVLSRLQRALTGGLFMHEQKQVFVTFSAGATVYREGEALEAALDRADQALYQAKRSGKNRSCVA